MPSVDPVASFRITPIQVVLGGREFLLGARPAADWLECIFDGTAYQIIPGWIEDARDRHWINEQALDGIITEDEIDEVTKEAISVAAGRPYWWAFNLLATTGRDALSWSSIHGSLALHGIHADEVSLGFWLDALYASLLEKMHEQNEKTSLDTHLETPPAGTAFDEESEGAAFMALMNTM